jgi:hypothetical protein
MYVVSRLSPFAAIGAIFGLVVGCSASETDNTTDAPGTGGRFVATGGATTNSGGSTNRASGGTTSAGGTRATGGTASTALCVANATCTGTTTCTNSSGATCTCNRGRWRCL